MTVTGESRIWIARILGQNGREESIVLKEVAKREYEDECAMEEGRRFYEYLRSFPGFGEFVHETSLFEASIMQGEKPKMFRQQRFIDGTPLDQLTDDELYANPEVVRQLLKLVNATIDILKATHEKRPRPDFLRTPVPASWRVNLNGLLANPRYTSNVMVAKEPDEKGKWVFFVDTAQNADERVGNIRGAIQRILSSPFQDFFLKRWKAELEHILK